MMDTVTPEVRSNIMRKIGGKDTKPEINVRKALHARGFRFRKNVKGMPGTPDILFSKRRMVIQVFGCFWHQHSCRRTHIPQSNVAFWTAKFQANWARDRRDIKRLRDLGYVVIVAYECRLEKDLAREMCRMIKILGRPVCSS